MWARTLIECASAVREVFEILKMYDHVALFKGKPNEVRHERCGIPQLPGEMATLDVTDDAVLGERELVRLRLWRQRSHGVDLKLSYAFEFDGAGGADMHYAPDGGSLCVWLHSPGDDLIVVDLDR